MKSHLSFWTTGLRLEFVKDGVIMFFRAEVNMFVHQDKTEGFIRAKLRHLKQTILKMFSQTELSNLGSTLNHP